MNPDKPVRNTLVYLVCIGAWLMLFCSGIVIGTKWYRSQLYLESFSWESMCWLAYCWVMIAMNYSMTNIAILCCLASVIGGMTHQDNKEDAPRLMARGLFIYMFFISGMYVIDSSPLADITQERYLRMGSLLSFFSFVAGYNPEVFQTFMAKSSDHAKKLAERTGQQQQAKS